MIEFYGRDHPGWHAGSPSPDGSQESQSAQHGTYNKLAELSVSHADNHFFHLTVVSDWFLSTPLCSLQSARPLLSLDPTHHPLCGYRSELLLQRKHDWLLLVRVLSEMRTGRSVLRMIVDTDRDLY